MSIGETSTILTRGLMGGISCVELQDQIVRYLANRISLGEFRNWFDAASWDAEIDSKSELSAMIGEIELRLAEYSDGHWTEEELREQLKKVVRDQFVVVEVAAQTVSGSSIKLVESKVGKLQSVGTKYAWEAV
jgi:hypothetical protein